MAPLSILSMIAFGTYVAHFLSKCHDYVTGAHSFMVGYFVIYFFIAAYTGLVDPGYVQRDLSEDVPQDTRRKIKCKLCNTYRGENVIHCESCGVCVKDFDHHCGVLGNCISSRN